MTDFDELTPVDIKHMSPADFKRALAEFNRRAERARADRVAASNREETKRFVDQQAPKRR